MPPSFESNNLPAARLWLEVDKSFLNIYMTNTIMIFNLFILIMILTFTLLKVGKSDLKSAQSNLAAGHFMWAAYAARMVRIAPDAIKSIFHCEAYRARVLKF